MNTESRDRHSWRTRARELALSLTLVALFTATVLLGSHGPQRELYIDIDRPAGVLLAITLRLRRIPND